jgi:hypothetical protein
MDDKIIMNFFVVYVKTQKKFQKYVKVNKIRNKYVLDVKKIIQEEELENDTDKKILKIIVFNKIQQAMEKNKDIYYIPNFEDPDFSILKLLNLKKILENNNFNILLFYDEFQKTPYLIEEVFDNLSKFTNSQILKDY